MKVHTLRVGPIDTNCYIVEDEKTKEALIIDPGDRADKVLKLLEKFNLKAKRIVITHGHFDHVGGNRGLKEALKVELCMHDNDLFGIASTDSPKPDCYLKGGEKIKVGSLEFTVIHTPGHSPGGICLYCEKEKTLFSGDTLFFETYGRVDLPFSSPAAMKESLTKLLALPKETKVYPGHGRPTTIGDEQGLLKEL